MTLRLKPSDFDATPQLKDAHSRMFEAHSLASAEIDHLMKLKNKAKGREKTNLAGIINDLA